MEAKNKTHSTAFNHGAILCRIRQKVLHLLDNGRLTPQELQIIFELEIQVQKYLHELLEQEKSPKEHNNAQETTQTVVDDSLFPQSQDKSSEPTAPSSFTLTTSAQPQPQSTFSGPLPTRADPRQTSDSHQTAIQHIPSNRPNVMHYSRHGDTQNRLYPLCASASLRESLSHDLGTTMPKPCRNQAARPAFAQASNKPAWPMPPPRRAPYNPAFAVTQAIPAPRSQQST